MAEHIEFTVRRDVRQELSRKVAEAPVQHAEAILAAYELLQEAQDHGVLDTLRGAIGAGDAFIEKAAEYANTPEGIRTMRNLLVLGKLAGQIDPALLQRAVGALTASFPDPNSPQVDPPSLWQILRRLTGPESRRTLGILAGFTEHFGREPQ